jgi:hypothetical protein
VAGDGAVEPIAEAAQEDEQKSQPIVFEGDGGGGGKSDRKTCIGDLVGRDAGTREPAAEPFQAWPENFSRSAVEHARDLRSQPLPV